MTSKPLRGVLALVLSIATGVAATFVGAFVLPWAYVALRWGTGPGAGDALFIVAQFALLILAVPILVLVICLIFLFYRKLSPYSPPSPDGV